MSALQTASLSQTVSQCSDPGKYMKFMGFLEFHGTQQAMECVWGQSLPTKNGMNPGRILGRPADPLIRFQCGRCLKASMAQISDA